jgi:formate dehydrogenase major subunit
LAAPTGGTPYDRHLGFAPVYVEGDRLKGRYAYSFLNSPKRLSRSVIREAGRWKEISWDEALDHCARELQRISAIYGPDSIGILGSARATNEENYLAQKFACIVLGTNNVDCCVRVCHTPSAAAMKAMLGAGAATNSFDDIEHAHTFFLVSGANSLESHPIVGARIGQQTLRHGANLIVPIRARPNWRVLRTYIWRSGRAPTFRF